MRIGLTFDLRADYLAQGYGEEETAEFDSEVTIAGLCGALAELGHAPVRIGNVRRLTERLARGERFDAVFNICEGLKGVAREAQVPAVLEAYDVPYVFSDPLTLALALDKGMAKRVVRDAGIATPDFAVIECAGDIEAIALPFPVFAKPVGEGSGKGVSAASRADNGAALARTVHDLLDRFHQPVLVETFLPGREFTVGITGTGRDARSLGVMEVIFGENAKAHGYGYENKEYYEDKMSYRIADDDEARAAADVAVAAWRALRCRDGGRVDIRSDAEGRPHFIEVNPLAGLNPEKSDLVFLTRFQGIGYRDLIGRIMESFFKRHPELLETEKIARPRRARRLSVVR